MNENTSFCGKVPDRGRAFRLFHAKRLRASRAHYWSHIPHSPDQMDPRQAGAVIQHPKVCSCFQCGNPRKWFNERTLAERKGFDALRDGLEELVLKVTDELA